MPYDPTYPPTNTALRADEMRAQFTGLKALIDTVAPTQLRDAEHAMSLDAVARTLTVPGALTATGFGGLVYYDQNNPNYDGTLFNGDYALTGTHNGKPYWTNATGLVLYYLVGQWLAGKDFITFTFRGFGSRPVSGPWNYPGGPAGIVGSFAWADPPVVVATWADGTLRDAGGNAFSTGAYAAANPGFWAGSPPATQAELNERVAALLSNNGANPIP